MPALPKPFLWAAKASPPLGDMNAKPGGIARPAIFGWPEMGADTDRASASNASLNEANSF